VFLLHIVISLRQYVTGISKRTTGIGGQKFSDGFRRGALAPISSPVRMSLCPFVYLHDCNNYSANTASGYGLDDRAIEVRSLAEVKDFSSSLCVQASSGAHPASCTMGTGVLSPGVKCCRGVTLTTHPHLVPVVNDILSPLAPPWRVAGLPLIITLDQEFPTGVQRLFSVPRNFRSVQRNFVIELYF
jgi:hypothetical protein